MTKQGLMRPIVRPVSRPFRTACTVLLALGLMAGHTAAEPKRVPGPHSYRKPPGNVAADDYMALLAGSVFVGFVGGKAGKFPNHDRDTIEVFYHGRDGRFAICGFPNPGIMR